MAKVWRMWKFSAQEYHHVAPCRAERRWKTKNKAKKVIVFTYISLFSFIITVSQGQFLDITFLSSCTVQCILTEIRHLYFTTNKQLLTIFYSLAALVRKILFLARENEIHVPRPCNMPSITSLFYQCGVNIRYIFLQRSLTITIRYFVRGKIHIHFTVHEERKVISTRESRPLLLSRRPKQNGTVKNFKKKQIKLVQYNCC